jgi:Na+/melibiose symporter-like transporter
VGGQVCGTIVAFFLSPWLLTVVGIRPAYAGVILLTGRLWDALTDPAIGALSDRTKTRWGRRRPWMAGSLIPCAVFYVALFTAPELLGVALQTPGAKFAYYCTAFWGYQLAFTAYFVPYTALTMELSHVPSERDSATLWRMVFEVLGVMVGVVSQGIIISQLAPEGSTVETQQRAYLISALCVAGFSSATNLVSVVGVREGLPRPKSVDAVEGEQGGGCGPTTSGGVGKALCGARAYMLLNVSYLFTWLCFQVLSTNLVLYLQYAVGMYSQFQYILGAVMSSAVVFMVVIFLAMRNAKIEKSTMYRFGMLAYLPFPMAMYFLPRLGSPPPAHLNWVIYLVAAGSGIGVATSFLLPWSLLPDTIDDAERVGAVNPAPLRSTHTSAR